MIFTAALGGAAVAAPSLYVPAWPGLGPELLAPPIAEGESPFPFGAPRAIHFFRARHAIYHLARALGVGPKETVLAPDYHSGNEIAALRAAGAAIRLYRIGRDLNPDLDQVDRLCAAHRPQALLAIHYLGWPQPIRELAELCRRRGIVLIEDCALALLSRLGSKPLGTFGDFSVFCLYKTLPVPNGGLLAQNRQALEPLERIDWEGCGLTSVAGRTAELLLERLRGRAGRLGGTLAALKRAAGSALRSAGVRSVPVGDIGFTLDDVNTRISSLARALLPRFDYGRIHARRREHFLYLKERLQDQVPMLREDLPEGVCPLFLPLLVKDKAAAASALRTRGIQAVEFWNDGDPLARSNEGPDARYLREHVLEIPIHQDLMPEQIEHTARAVWGLRAQ